MLSALLVFTCLLAGVTLDRKLLPLVLLLLLYNLGGAFALIPVIGDEPSRRFILISFYMAFTAIVFAMMFSTDCVRRAEILRRAYIIAGVCAAIAGIVGYFKGIDILTLLRPRARHVQGPERLRTVHDPADAVPDAVVPGRAACASCRSPHS